MAVENDIEHKLDIGLIEEMAELGILGVPIPRSTAARARLRRVRALLRGDRARRDGAPLIMGHVGLNSLSPSRYGTEEQKQRWIVPQAKGEKLACFGLTEPEGGLRAAAIRPTARREGTPTS